MFASSKHIEVIKIKIALFSGSEISFSKVYTPSVLQKLGKYGELSQRIDKSNIETHKEFLKTCEIAFATWGMPQFTGDEIKKYMPCLKIVFYSAGTVQYFAKPFLDSGIRVFSAFSANGVPVAEYTVSQIVLALKGYFQGAKRYKSFLPYSRNHTQNCIGAYGARVGLIGLGEIGSAVAEKLKELDVSVYAYDPFVAEDRANELGVTLCDMETIFKECDVISNHLANKKELKNIFNRELFSLMKPHSTFINTGRGDQVDEFALAKSLIHHPSITAVLDVLKNERTPFFSPLFWCSNAIITPHIAGSLGNETERMADYMIKQLDNYINGKPTKYEITKDMLKFMA